MEKKVETAIIGYIVFRVYDCYKHLLLRLLLPLRLLLLLLLFLALPSSLLLLLLPPPPLPLQFGMQQPT